MFTLEQIVPWGRSFDEYSRMFGLRDDDLRLRILGCGDGPASFNAEATARGGRVVSGDPIYRFDTGEIRRRIEETSQTVLEQTRANAHEFVWTDIPSIEALADLRLSAMDLFLRDYESGRREGRYIDAALPALPFEDEAFDLALSSHFLLLYTAQLGDVFHRAAVRELCRVARQVRIFPLLALGAVRSPLVEVVADEATGLGCTVTIERVPYEFQRGGNEMLRIVRV